MSPRSEGHKGLGAAVSGAGGATAAVAGDV